MAALRVIALVPLQAEISSGPSSQGVLKRVSSAAAAVSSTIRGVGVLLQEAGARPAAVTSPSTARRMTGALPSPQAISTTFCARQDRVDAHRDRLARDVPLAEEVAGGVQAGDAVERDQARAAVARRAGLVEADVAGAADAQDLEVEPAGLA